MTCLGSPHNFGPLQISCYNLYTAQGNGAFIPLPIYSIPKFQHGNGKDFLSNHLKTIQYESHFSSCAVKVLSK